LTHKNSNLLLVRTWLSVQEVKQQTGTEDAAGVGKVLIVGLIQAG
jgi:hypothetical protein